MYFLIKHLLFLFDPEKVHYFVLKWLKILFRVKWIYAWVERYYRVDGYGLPIQLWGIEFPNRVGLAAGFDKDGAHIREMAAFGFGHIEIGTLTPMAQKGNEKPRLFRLPQSEALINRMGFNNQGTDNFIKNLKKLPNSKIIIGGNIGKNKDTPTESAAEDYLKAWASLYPYVHYFVVNVSSPNTPNLRQLQEKEPLKTLLTLLKDTAKKESKTKPILLKISPDLSYAQLDDILEIVQELKIEGIVATNTTLSREGIGVNETYRAEMGGLSGKPLLDKSTEIIRYIAQKTHGELPIIGVGGINNAQDAQEKLRAGASLVQIYTGFIYHGPGLVRKINQSGVKPSQD